MKKKWVLLAVPLLLLGVSRFFSPTSASTQTEAKGDYFQFDGAKQIEFATGSADEIAKKIKVEDEEGEDYDVVVNVIGTKTLVISPIEKISKPLKVENQTGYKVKDFTGNVYVQNEKNLKKIAKYINVPMPVLYEDRALTMDAAPAAKEAGSNTKSAAPQADTNKSEAAATGDYSKTNIQTQGVDEADIVKTDGKYIYYVRDFEVAIIDANTKNLKKIATIKDDNNSDGYSYYDQGIEDIYIDNGKLIVIKNTFKKSNTNRQITRIETYDITNITAPKKIKTTDLNGYYSQSRKKDSIVYTISTDYLNVKYDYVSPKKILGVWETTPKETYDLDYTGFDLAKMIYIPFTPSTEITNISSTSINPNGVAESLLYMGSTGNLYMSNDNLYISSQEFNYRNWNEIAKTNIKKFAINNGKFNFVGQNFVEGYLVNQFSLNEEKGVLFVSHTENMYTEDSQNSITSFDKNMKKISKLGGLAKGEKIYSTRFIQDKAYLVTFKEVDPLFVIDIANPSKMKVLGYLKIPGYSSYLHPYKNGYLIGFGYQTAVKPAGNIVNDGFKISLFDVRDFANPKEVDVKTIGARGTYSEITSDHKALMFDTNRDIFSIPMNVTQAVKKTYNGKETEEVKSVFNGAYVMSVSEKGFEIKGKISHYTTQEQNDLGENYFYDYNKNIRRSVQIGDNIYTLSNGVVKVNNINTLKEIATAKLDK